MRRIVVIIIIFIIAATGACRKKRGPANVDSIKQDNSIDSLLVMSALVNGIQWKTDSAYSYKVKNSANDTTTFSLLLSATQLKDGVASTITFNITDFKGPGNYNINPPVNTAAYYLGNIRHYGSAGTFSVLADTGGVLSGSFSFVADTVSIVNGSFTVAVP